MRKQMDELKSIINLTKAKRGSTVVGTGFLPLDLVYRDDVPSKLRAYAGGTCGNILAIMAFLGWDVYPVARHNDSRIAQIIKDDLRLWGVHLDYISLEPMVAPPVVVQKTFSKPKAGKTHSFAWACPGCGAVLPNFKPVLAKSALEISDVLPKAKVFFFDRVSRAAIDIARKYAESGGAVVFEPSMIGDPKLFSQALEVSHIFKYSQDRISHVNEVRRSAEPMIEIETLGSAGLRYRRRGKTWKEFEAFSTKKIIDTSGAGDWCTAGIVHLLSQDGFRSVRNATDDDILAAVQLGQAMGAWTCQFEGPRGGMYGLSWADWKREVAQIAKGGSSISTSYQSTRACPEVLRDVCCQKPSSPLNHSAQVPQSNSRVCATLLHGSILGKALSQ